MRRIVLPLIAVAAAYCTYLTTVPPPVVLPAAAGAPSVRVTREISIGASTYYAACLGRYGKRDEALVEAARLALRGAAGNVREDNGEYAVIGAIYETQGEAGSVCARISAREDIEAEVMRCASAALRLRVTAGDVQIAAMEEMLNVLEEIPEELNALSYDMDSGEKSVSMARTLVSVLLKRVSDALETLKDAAGDTEDKFCRGLMNIGGELHAALAYISGENSMDSLAVSSAMKNAAVSAMLGISDLTDALR